MTCLDDKPATVAQGIWPPQVVCRDRQYRRRRGLGPGGRVTPAPGRLREALRLHGPQHPEGCQAYPVVPHFLDRIAK